MRVDCRGEDFIPAQMAEICTNVETFLAIAFSHWLLRQDRQKRICDSHPN
jgi:hypothetical protein